MDISDFVKMNISDFVKTNISDFVKRNILDIFFRFSNTYLSWYSVLPSLAVMFNRYNVLRVHTAASVG